MNAFDVVIYLLFALFDVWAFCAVLWAIDRRMRSAQSAREAAFLRRGFGS